MSNKKVAILTTYFANFGSFFQATALQNAIEKLGYECDLINEKSRLFKSYKMFISVLATPFLPRNVRECVAKRVPQYYAFLRLKKDVEKLKVSSKFSFDIKRLSKKYSCIIVGSDELWSANKKTIVYYAPYFGVGINCPHITYGPSATMYEGATDTRIKEITMGLQTFQALSVRDVFTQNFVKELIGIEPQLVIDPTLMNPYFINLNRSIKNYVLVYGQHYSEDEKKIIRNFAEIHGYKVMAAAWRQDDWCDGFIDTESAEHMQRAFSESQYCFPSTFHGVIFSILNHKNFVAFINPLRGRKVKMLLETLQLEDRIYAGDEKLLSEDVDFIKVDDNLQILREKSMNYLNSALKEVCNE